MLFLDAGSVIFWMVVYSAITILAPIKYTFFRILRILVFGVDIRAHVIRRDQGSVGFLHCCVVDCSCLVVEVNSMDQWHGEE